MIVTQVSQPIPKQQTYSNTAAAGVIADFRPVQNVSRLTDLVINSDALSTWSIGQYDGTTFTTGFTGIANSNREIEQNSNFQTGAAVKNTAASGVVTIIGSGVDFASHQ